MNTSLWDLNIYIPFTGCKLPIAGSGTDLPLGDLIDPLPPGVITAGDLIITLPPITIDAGDLRTALSESPAVLGDELTTQPPETIDAGDLRIAEPGNQITAGPLRTALTENVILLGDLLPSIPQPGPPYPLNHARIGYDSIIPGNVDSVDVTESQETALFVTTPSTWDRWRPGDNDTIEIELILPGQVDYIGIAAHTLGSAGATVDIELQEDFGDPFIALTSVVPTTDNAILVIFPEQQVKTIRLVISGTSGGFEIGVVYAGVALQMIRPLYGGHSPINLSASNSYIPNTSDGGQFLGRDIVRRGFATSASFKNLPAQWYRDEFQPFVEHAQTLPYFWAWNLLEFPDEVAYCWNDSDIQPTNSGTRDLMTVNWSLDGHR